MAWCKLKDTFPTNVYKLDTIAQWESVRLGTQGSWVRILFWEKKIIQGGQNGAPWGDPKNTWDDIRNFF